MSTEIEKDILCPQCGQSQKYRLYASINAKENPELKRRVLSETLFDWRCKRCNYFAAMAYSFLYTDPEAGYIVCVAPGGEGRTAQPTQEIQSYTKRVVKNLAELKEKGVRLIDQTPRYGAGGARIAFLHPKATHGVLLELCERK